MSHVSLETLRALLLLAILLTLWLFRRHSCKTGACAGLGLIMAGFGLMLLGTLLHITGDQPGQEEFQTPTSRWVEHLAGYVGGLLLTLLGLLRWLTAMRAQAHRQGRLLTAVARSQASFIDTTETRQAFDALLAESLALTDSTYGFIGEVHRRDGQTYVKTLAMSSKTENGPARHPHEQQPAQGMAPSDPRTLCGAVLDGGKPIIDNDPAHAQQHGGLPPGHPPLHAFLGLPLHAGGRAVGIMCIANRRGGYDGRQIEFLRPLSGAIGHLMAARQAELARQANDASYQRLALVASRTNNGVVIADREKRVEWVNAGFERLTGYTLAEVRGRKPGDVLQGPATDPATVARMRAALLRGATFEVEVLNYAKDGHIYWINLSVDPLRDEAGEIRGYIGIETDITERKRMERLKSEFLATVSHELRTPLTAIRGALGLMAGGALGALPAQATRMIDIAHRNSEHLTHLINDLLDMEKMAAGGMSFELRPHGLMPLVEQAMEAIQAYGEAHGISFRLTARAEDAVVRVDAKRFLQVMANLLSNAAKFSPENGQVEIAVSRLNDHVRVSVRDHGPGIPAHFSHRVFEKFSQADASDTRQRSGSGLGLAITRELVQRMSGQIGFDSVEGRGTTFHVDLPVLAAASLDDLAGTPAQELPDAPRLLVVEDHEDVAGLLATMLRRAGFNVDLARDGGSALARLQERAYAAMTLDLHLPDRHGAEIIRMLRAAPEYRDLPIIVVSAYAQEGQLALAGEFDTVDWLAKPFDEHRLLAAVRKAVHGDAAAKPRVLHVEDDADLLQVVATLARETANFVPARTLAEARARLRQGDYDVVILDLDLPDGSGWSLMADLRALRPPPRVIILSGQETATSQADAVAAAMVKSRISNDELLATLQRVIRQSADRMEPPHAQA